MRNSHFIEAEGSSQEMAKQNFFPIHTIVASRGPIKASLVRFFCLVKVLFLAFSN